MWFALASGTHSNGSGFIQNLSLFKYFAQELVVVRHPVGDFLRRADDQVHPEPARNALPDRHRLLFMSASAFLYGGAGFALVLGSAAAVWFLGIGLLVQGLYYGLFRRNAAGRSTVDANSQRQAWNAAIISTAAFALAAYALKAGVLT